MILALATFVFLAVLLVVLRHRIGGANTTIFLAFFFALLFGLHRQQQAIDDQKAETRERIRQTCAAQEKDYGVAITQLARTYDYLVTARDKHADLYRIVRAGLSKTEADTAGSRPAAFCGFKLRPIPQRPSALRK